MRFLRQNPYLALITLFLLTALACQAVTDLQTASQAPETRGETNAAAAPLNQSQETEGERPTINTQLPALEGDLQSILIELYRQINPSVVHIFVFDAQGIALASGSGFVYDNNGHIITNNHVVADASSLEVVFASGERRRAEVTGRDVDSDLAVIRVTSLPAEAAPIPLGDSSQLQVGQFVAAIGNPFGEAGSMSVGIVSGLGRTLESQRVVAGGRFSIPQVIQTDTAINLGNSGGPLLNLRGEVVGVNSAIQSQTGFNSGVGYSLPVNAVHRIVPALIADGRYTYPFIGISMVPRPFTLDELETLGLPPNGVFVTRVTAGTPADRAGLIGHELAESFTADGDYITAIDGETVRSSDDLLSYLVFETEVGQTVELTVIRNGEEIVVPLTLGERP